MDTIYVENAVCDLKRTRDILNRYPKAKVIEIDRYGDVFNAPHQNFRSQKQNPSLILAEKKGRRVLPTPPDYHIGGDNNYYFSHMLNCIYDCRYCFLQGMYRSANYVVFVNFEDFFEDIHSCAEQHGSESWFFSGYDCDSLALEPLTNFMVEALDFFETTQKANLEIRTKSSQVRQLLKRKPMSNCVVAMSLSPEAVVRAEEHRTPSVAKRLNALKELQMAGWHIGLRFDPVLESANFSELYQELIEQTFTTLDASHIHSVSLGPFRLPKPFFKRMVKIYPDSKILASNLTTQESMVSYPDNTEQDMLQFVESLLLKHISAEQYFPCVSISGHASSETT